MNLPDYLAFIKLGAVIMFNYPIASGVTVMESLSLILHLRCYRDTRRDR